MEKYPCGCRPSPPVTSCGCHHSPCPGDCVTPPFPAPGNILLQKIMGSGQMHQRRKCYPIRIQPLPCSSSGTLTLLSVSVCGTPAWEEIPCHERGVKQLLVSIPLSLAFQDGGGCAQHASGFIEETLRLRLNCPPCDAWRGQIVIQAAARLCGTVCVPADACVDVPLELILCGHLLSPCAMGAPNPRPCPPPKPWYPQPIFNPYQDG